MEVYSEDRYINTTAGRIECNRNGYPSTAMKERMNEEKKRIRNRRFNGLRAIVVVFQSEPKQEVEQSCRSLPLVDVSCPGVPPSYSSLVCSTVFLPLVTAIAIHIVIGHSRLNNCCIVEKMSLDGSLSGFHCYWRKELITNCTLSPT